MAEIEIFVHSNVFSDVELRQLDESATVADLAASVGLPAADVWLEGAEGPLDAVSELGEVVSNRSSVQVGTCKKVGVTVHYNGQTRTYEEPPAATLQSVYSRATAPQPEGFGLDETAKLEHTLQVFGTQIQPDLSRHIGAFASDECTAAFDLVLQQRFQGA